MKRSIALIVAIAVLCMLAGCASGLADNNDISNIIYDSDTITVIETHTEPAVIYVTEPYREPTLEEKLCAHKWVRGKKIYTFNLDGTYSLISDDVVMNEDGHYEIVYPVETTGTWVMYNEIPRELRLYYDDSEYQSLGCGDYVVYTNEEIESGRIYIPYTKWTVTDKYLVLREEIFTAED